MIKKLVSNKDYKRMMKLSHGYCPISHNSNIPLTDDDKCQCKDFRDKCNKPDWYGQCGCGLFEKVEE